MRTPIPCAPTPRTPKTEAMCDYRDCRAPWTVTVPGFGCVCALHEATVPARARVAL